MLRLTILLFARCALKQLNSFDVDVSALFSGARCLRGQQLEVLLDHWHVMFIKLLIVVSEGGRRLLIATTITRHRREDNLGWLKSLD